MCQTVMFTEKICRDHQTQLVFSYFLILGCSNPPFFAHHPKKHLSGHFLDFSFLVSPFLSSYNIRKTITKIDFLLSKNTISEVPLLVCALYLHPHTLAVNLKMPQNAINFGKISKTNLDQILTYHLDQLFTYKAPQIGPDNNTTIFFASARPLRNCRSSLRYLERAHAARIERCFVNALLLSSLSLSLSLSIPPSVYLSVINQSINHSINLSVSLIIYQCISLSFYLSIYLVSIYVSIYLFIHLPRLSSSLRHSCCFPFTLCWWALLVACNLINTPSCFNRSIGYIVILLIFPLRQLFLCPSLSMHLFPLFLHVFSFHHSAPNSLEDCHLQLCSAILQLLGGHTKLYWCWDFPFVSSVFGTANRPNRKTIKHKWSARV